MDLRRIERFGKRHKGRLKGYASMSNIKKNAWPWRTGRVIAGLTTAWLLAGCGGGGGGGGGGSSPGSTSLPTPFASKVVTAGQSARIYDAALPASNSPEIDVSSNALPSGNLSSVTVSLAIDPSPPSLGGNTLESPAVYDIETAGTTFSGSGMTITLPTATNGGSSLVPLIYYYDATTQQWMPVTNSNGLAGDTYTTGYVTIQTMNIAAGRGANGTGPTDYAVLLANVGPPPAAP
jgi:hypothetical protein